MTAATALPAVSTSSNEAMMTRASRGVGSSFTTTSVTTISMPSEPMQAPSRSSPGVSSATDSVVAAGAEAEPGSVLPSVMGSPSMVKPRTASTLWTVRPYFRQCTPPEFSATLPPMVQAICEDGSGA